MEVPQAIIERPSESIATGAAVKVEKNDRV
jgi:hypothetical protein